ncbi:MAG: TA system VapC family ribonuclease toxin [Chthoniobacter sp.]|uniref:TA system VapC family ribonuclease toxin n=1 Tax=Chthoniobacter sp. TaxID=2510640 RepID=UPI0032A31C42
MRYLLDVNVLVAWGWADHADHERAARWIHRIRKKKGDHLLTSAIPQLGFVRVSVQRTGGQILPEAAGQVLAGMLRSLGAAHQFVPDDQEAVRWPAWCTAAARTTDAHLIELATIHGAKLATLDQGIPGAIVIDVS